MMDAEEIKKTVKRLLEYPNVACVSFRVKVTNTDGTGIELGGQYYTDDGYKKLLTEIGKG